MSVLVYGYGNPGRVDDGLGPACAAALAARGIEGVSVESGYQLQVEDAVLIAQHDVVVFADADPSCNSPFELRPIEPRSEVSFSTHSVAPEALLALAHELFGASTVGFVLAIRAHQLGDFGEGLSAPARADLELAVDHLEQQLRGGFGARFAAASSLEADHALFHARS